MHVDRGDGSVDWSPINISKGAVKIGECEYSENQSASCLTISQEKGCLALT